VSLHVADSLLAHALSMPQMITEEGFAQILAILTRTNVSPDAIALREGEVVNRAGMSIRADGTAIIPVVGPIVRRADLFSRISGATDLGTMRDMLVSALDARSVTRIMLMMDTPGGETTGIAEMAAYIREVDAQKPVIAYAEGLMASAGYYLASAAREIVGASQSVIGSIGVRIAVRVPSASESATTFEFVSSQSPKKALDPRSPDGQHGYKQLMDDLAAVFVRDVATYRGVSEDTVLSDYGQGWVFAADRALESGLIDRIETQQATLDRLAATVPPSPAERAGTSRRPTAVSTAIAPEEPMKITHRAPDTGDGTGGNGADPNQAVLAKATATATTAERSRISHLLTVAHASIDASVQSAIDDGTTVEAFALARAKAERDADKAGAEAHRKQQEEAEANNKQLTTPLTNPNDHQETDAAVASRIVANARAAGVAGVGGK
jgi:capsid assembly protease